MGPSLAKVVNNSRSFLPVGVIPTPPHRSKKLFCAELALEHPYGLLLSSVLDNLGGRHPLMQAGIGGRLFLSEYVEARVL